MKIAGNFVALNYIKLQIEIITDFIRHKTVPLPKALTVSRERTV